MHFRGQYEFLSNFFMSPLSIEGIVFPTVEHAYQAMKSKDRNVWRVVSQLEYAHQAKMYGKGIAIDPSVDWDKMRDEVMFRLLTAKFNIPHLRVALIKVQQDIVENNYWHDNYWGICLCDKCEGIKGQNRLGKMISVIRNGIIEQLTMPEKEDIIKENNKRQFLSG